MEVCHVQNETILFLHPWHPLPETERQQSRYRSSTRLTNHIRQTFRKSLPELIHLDNMPELVQGKLFKVAL